MGAGSMTRRCWAPPEWGRSVSYAELGAAIDQDGIAAYLPLVRDLAAAGDAVVPAAAAILRSDERSAVLRERAFAVVCCVLTRDDATSPTAPPRRAR